MGLEEVLRPRGAVLKDEPPENSNVLPNPKGETLKFDRSTAIGTSGAVVSELGGPSM